MRFQAQIVEAPSIPKSENSIRIVCFSDSHGFHKDLDVNSFFPADLLIFAGDLTMFGNPSEVQSFKDWFESINCPNKLLIPGNLDLTFDTNNLERFKSRILDNVDTNVKLETVKSTFLNDAKFIYAEHSTIEVLGLKIFASPYTPEFMDFAFQYKGAQDAKKIWSQIPSDIDILVTHGPPKGTCDQTQSGFHAGCDELYRRIQSIQPSLSVFGHIHEGHGHGKIGETLCCNVALVNPNRQIVHKPTYIDLIPT